MKRGRFSQTELKAIMENNHDGHRQRLRSEFLTNGLNSLPPQRVLEILLFYSIPRSDTYPIACRLIERFGSIQNVFSADCDELKQVKGISDGSAALIKFAASLMNYKYHDPIIGEEIKNINDLLRVFKKLFTSIEQEQVRLLCIDENLRIADNIHLANGGVSSVSFDPNDVLQCVKKSKCRFCAIGHNHPNASCEPSKEDVESTNRLKRMLEQNGCTLLEHIIIGSDGESSVMRGDVRYLFV